MKEDSLKRGLQKVSLLDESIRKELTEINIQKYQLIGERLEKLNRSELSLFSRVQIDESYHNIKSEVSKILKSDYNQIRNITGLSDNQMESIVELQSSVSMIINSLKFFSTLFFTSYSIEYASAKLLRLLYGFPLSIFCKPLI